MRHDHEADRRWARSWLFESALPLWWQTGADRANGGFHDKIDLQGRAVDLPKRLRVQARQVFVYSVAGNLGWEGPWRQAVDHGLDFIATAHKRPDGLFDATISQAGESDGKVDLYDQAFVLFALAASYKAIRAPHLREQAEALLDALDAKLRHPIAGFEEAAPRVLPLRSNPHMHMLEAVVRGAFEVKARELVGLACDHLLDPETGAVGEYYDGDWRFAAGSEGRLREPGHQFEWAYLLNLASRLLAIDLSAAVERLERFGSRHGIIGERAIFSVDQAGRVVDGSSRLWAQTERLRAMLVLAPTMAPPAREKAMIAAGGTFALLRRHLDVPIPGLWRERADEAGRWIDEPSPASSLYHIVTGIEPLLDTPAASPIACQIGTVPMESSVTAGAKA